MYPRFETNLRLQFGGQQWGGGGLQRKIHDKSEGNFTNENIYFENYYDEQRKLERII